jgi:hypothetical protein
MNYGKNYQVKSKLKIVTFTKIYLYLLNSIDTLNVPIFVPWVEIIKSFLNIKTEVWSDIHQVHFYQSPRVCGSGNAQSESDNSSSQVTPAILCTLSTAIRWYRPVIIISLFVLLCCCQHLVTGSSEILTSRTLSDSQHIICWCTWRSFRVCYLPGPIPWQNYIAAGPPSS